jgi:hypothetical protein
METAKSGLLDNGVLSPLRSAIGRRQASSVPQPSEHFDPPSPTGVRTGEAKRPIDGASIRRLRSVAFLHLAVISA